MTNSPHFSAVDAQLGRIYRSTCNKLIEQSIHLLIDISRILVAHSTNHEAPPYPSPSLVHSPAKASFELSRSFSSVRTFNV